MENPFLVFSEALIFCLKEASANHPSPAQAFIGQTHINKINAVVAEVEGSEAAPAVEVASSGDVTD